MKEMTMKGNDIEEGFWVFVSHSTKDFERVRLVRNALEDRGFRPILFYLKCMEDEDEINGLLKREIDARRHFILCDSSNAQASKFVQSEVDYIRSKRRMYEVVDLSQIDLDNSDAEDILRLIKPFIRRTTVYISRSYFSEITNSPYLYCELRNAGFHVLDLRYGLTGNEISDMDFDSEMKKQLKSTLNDGYLIVLIENSNYYYILKEFEYAFQINPKRLFPVIIGNPIEEQTSPEIKQRMVRLLHSWKESTNMDILHLSSDVHLSNNAFAIANQLASFDLENQYK